MKSFYIIIAVVLVIGGLVWFNLPAKEVVAPVVETVPSQTNESAPTAEGMGMTAEEHASMGTKETTTGTDVGMELPETDMSGMDHSGMNMGVDSNAKVFNVSGKNFVFDVTQIQVKKGDTVTINFESADGFHDLVIDEFKAQTARVQTGGTTQVTFVADKIGTFEYYCSVGKHRMNGMVGKLIVQ